jgi:hypothetical protein
MVHRLIAVVAILTTAALLGDAAQVLCFGEDGHVAFERLISAEHLGAASSRVGDVLASGSSHSSERTHVDVSVGEARVKDRLVPHVAPGMTSVAVAAPPDVYVTLPRSSLVLEAPRLSSVRTTVLRT